MEAFRVRIINADGSISVLDKSFSQVCEMFKFLSPEDKRAFWDKREVTLLNGEKVLFMREV